MSGTEVQAVTPDDVRSLGDFIRGTVRDAGAEGAVLGLSGGLDSAVAAKLCADALGPDRVLGVFMPSAFTPECDYGSTQRMASEWGIGYRVISIQDAADAFISMIPEEEVTPLARGNITARCRMIVLYDHAKRMKYLVFGTSNLSEMKMGYFTKFGDGASDVALLAGLYKTQVREIASMIGVPEDIIAKPPSAGLWEGQTDESEMGIAYEDLDRVLCGLDSGMGVQEISESTGVAIGKVSEIRGRVDSMSHKRCLPVRPGLRTVAR